MGASTIDDRRCGMNDVVFRTAPPIGGLSCLYYGALTNLLHCISTVAPIGMLRTVSVVEVVGCPDIPVPTNGWIDRRDDLMTVRCNDSHETWYLTCNGFEWIGTLANCSATARGLVCHDRTVIFYKFRLSAQLTKSLHFEAFGLPYSVVCLRDVKNSNSAAKYK